MTRLAFAGGRPGGFGAPTALEDVRDALYEVPGRLSKSESESEAIRPEKPARGLVRGGMAKRVQLCKLEGALKIRSKDREGETKSPQSVGDQDYFNVVYKSAHSSDKNESQDVVFATRKTVPIR